MLSQEESQEDIALIADMLSLPVDDRYPTLIPTRSARRRRLVRCAAPWADEPRSTATSADAVRRCTLGRCQFPRVAGQGDRSADEPTRSARHFVSSGIPAALGRPCRRQRDHTETADAKAGGATGQTDCGRTGIVPALLERIVAQTDGVPLFIEELTKAVLEFAAQADSSSAPLVPATLQASLIARLDRLPAAKQVAQIGAVIGREFAHTLLTAVANMPENATAARH